jgi:transposase-like protein
VGDGALGFWAALRDVFPSTKEQRCWVHKTANVVDALPKRLHPQAKSAIQAIYNAGSRTEALTAAKSFADAFSGFPKATAKIMDELDTLLAFYDFPKEHWAHLRTSNPIVIWSREEGVCDVDDRRLGHPVLRAGRGYLEGSSTQGSGRLSVRPTGGVAPLAA